MRIEALALSNAAYGVGSLGVVLGKVRCDGGETSILGCRLDELGHSDCSPNEAAGLVCRGKRLGVSKLLIPPRPPCLMCNMMYVCVCVTCAWCVWCHVSAGVYVICGMCHVCFV